MKAAQAQPTNFDALGQVFPMIRRLAEACGWDDGLPPAIQAWLAHLNIQAVKPLQHGKHAGDAKAFITSRDLESRVSHAACNMQVVRDRLVYQAD
eukprot:274438-Chlamydomonas_euryale.AAC.1